MKRLLVTLAAATATMPAVAGATTAPPDSGAAPSSTVTLVTHDSFPTEDTTLNDALAAFSADTGIEVEIVRAGDAGVMVSKAILTAGNPEGDVLYGIDNTYLSRAVDGGVFEPYTAGGLDVVPSELHGGPEVTPVDFGDVCVNVDTAWFAEAGLEPPADLQSLTDPTYRDLLVVENPASSSPGLAFLLASVAEFGEGWPSYWEDLVDNGVSVVDDWSAAYYESFSMAGGDRPLAVSYGSSPPFEMIYATEPIDAPTTTALADTCFRQVEFAGVLAGTDSPAEARQLVDFLLTPAFQETIALNLFMFPVNPDVELAPELAEFSVVPDDPLTLAPSDIAEHRDEWIETWTDTVLR